MMIDMSRRQALKLAGAGLAMGATPLAIPQRAHAATPAPFGSGTPSGPLNFTNGQTVNVVGRYFNSGGITVQGCASVSIQNCDFADGFGITMDHCLGKPTIAHNRFRNPGVNAIKVTNSFFDANSTIIHNSCRGRTAGTVDYILLLNSGGTSSAGPLRVEYNHVDSRDPVTRVISYPANGGSAYHYGGMTTTGGGNTSLVYNTCWTPGPYGMHIDSGTNIILYYNILMGIQTPNSVAAIKLMAAPGTIGNGGVPVQVDVDDIYWDDSTGTQVRYLSDGSLQEVYLSEVSVAVDLNATG